MAKHPAPFLITKHDHLDFTLVFVGLCSGKQITSPINTGGWPQQSPSLWSEPNPAQRSCRCPIAKSIWAQIGYSPRQYDLVPYLVVDNPAHGRWLEPDDFWGPYQPKPFYDSIWIKIRSKIRFKLLDEIQKAYDGRWEAELDTYDEWMWISLACSVNSQGKPWSTATLASIDRQRSPLKHLANNFQIT